MTSQSQLYPSARQLFSTGGLNWLTSNIKMALLADSFTPDFTQQYLSGIPSGSILATSANVASLTATNGYCGGATTSLGVVSSPVTAGKLIFYKDTGDPTTSPLIVFFDTPDLPGLPAVLDGQQYYVYANLNYGGWFRL